MPSASSALASGSSEASSAPPNTISSTASAAAMPTPSERPRPARSELLMAGPPSEMCTSAPSADSAALIRCRASAVVTWAEGRSQVTRAKATVPDRLICAAPAGP